MSCSPVDGILFIIGYLDFTYYLQLRGIEKLKFQYELIYDILKKAFNQYDVDWKILDDINDELSNNNWEMRCEWIRKKIQKKTWFTLVIKMDIDALFFFY
jgi:hypothetical protein